MADPTRGEEWRDWKVKMRTTFFTIYLPPWNETFIFKWESTHFFLIDKDGIDKLISITTGNPPT